MKNPEVYKQQALYWQNYRIIDRTVTACVHLNHLFENFLKLRMPLVPDNGE